VRNGADLFRIIGAVAALGALLPIASHASDGGKSEESTKQAGEDRWVPSLAITSGFTLQKHEGSAASYLEEPGEPIVPLRPSVDGDDDAVSPFVGGVLELMTPALPIPTRPRFFVSGEILPTFASDRDLALEGNPACIRGDYADAPCAKDEDGTRKTSFPEVGATGQGSRTSAEIDTLVYGANLGVAFPLQFGTRQLRIKPSVGWINYKVEAEGLVVDAACNPTGRCTNATPFFVQYGYLRERTLSGSGSQRFNGIGPGLDIELDTGRFGPIGSSLFIGARGYRILGDRTISFGAEQTFTAEMSDPDDPFQRIVFGPERDTASFEVEVDPWVVRAHVGIRFQWLGSQ
jgi:hypothetical protein